MPRIPIPFGQGLDRETGVLAMQVGGMEDLRNVHLMQGKLEVRRGFERVITFTDGSSNLQTHVLAGAAMLGRRTAIYVTYDDVNYKVNIFYGDGAGTWATWLAEWPFERDDTSDILDATNPNPPIISITEYNNTVFLAHTVAAVTNRAQTYFVYWDDVGGGYAAEALTVEWPTDDPGAVTHNVRFRGVQKHLEYVTGWGWGTKDEVRPELVRVSQPAVSVGQLQAGEGFDNMHYWIPGDEGDPVIACRPAEGTLICFKETETWELFGSSFINFGQRPIDRLFGLREPRLAISVEGAVFAWTNEGPRIFSGEGTSQPLELPLELTLPEPYDLVAQGDDQYAFAFYMPVYRSIWFVFGRRVYSIYIRVPGQWKWGYQELGFDPLCGFRLPQAGYGTIEPPTGAPSNPTASNITDTTLDLTVTNTGQDGDETLEVWLREGGGSWALNTGVEVGAAGTTVVPLDGLKAGWFYDVAVRYRRGPYYTAGYESPDPNDWPAAAKGDFTTTLATLPTIDGTSWARVSATVEQIGITFTPSYTGTGYDVEIRRDSSLINTVADVTGQQTYQDPTIAGETTEVYDIRMVTPYVNGAYTATVNRWAGPLQPTIEQVISESTDSYDAYWANGQAGVATEVWDDYPGLGGSPITLRKTTNIDADYTATSEIPGSGGSALDVWLRAKLTSYGIEDFSDYDGPEEVTVQS
jgi:hypothetical protein